MGLFLMSSDKPAVNNSSETSLRVFCTLSRRIIYSMLGESAGKAILFFLQEALRRDPFEVLWENPKAFYDEMSRIFGEGTKVLINILLTNIDRECGLSMNPEHFIEIVQSSNQGSLEEIRSFIRDVAKRCGGHKT